MDEKTRDTVSVKDIHEAVKNGLLNTDLKTKLKLGGLKKYLRLKRGKAVKDDLKYGVELCAFMAWTGALVVTAVILRSLYLMYLLPDERPI